MWKWNNYAAAAAAAACRGHGPGLMVSMAARSAPSCDWSVGWLGDTVSFSRGCLLPCSPNARGLRIKTSLPLSILISCPLLCSVLPLSTKVAPPLVCLCATPSFPLSSPSFHIDIMSRTQQDQFIDDDEEETCPLCVEEFDLSDRGFRPCPCGYQVCAVCQLSRLEA